MSNASTQSLIESGVALVRIPYGKKGSTTVGWNLREQVITDPNKYDLLRGMNIDRAHAYCTPSPTCAIDIDNYPAAQPWLAMHGIDLLALLKAGRIFL